MEKGVIPVETLSKELQETLEMLRVIGMRVAERRAAAMNIATPSKDEPPNQQGGPKMDDSGASNSGSSS